MQNGDSRNRQFLGKINTTSIVKLLILNLLSSRSYYGNELIDSIESILNYKWKPSPGMIYPLLRNMEENLLIEGWWDEPDKKSKRHYKITQAGINHYDKIKNLYMPSFKESKVIIDCIFKTVYNE